LKLESNTDEISNQTKRMFESKEDRKFTNIMKSFWNRRWRKIE